jgi:hypothetical protein
MLQNQKKKYGNLGAKLKIFLPSDGAEKVRELDK